MPSEEPTSGLTDREYENVKAFDEGMKAWQAGKFKSDCPHPIGTPRRQEWLGGYEVMVLSEVTEGISSPEACRR